MHAVEDHRAGGLQFAANRVRELAIRRRITNDDQDGRVGPLRVNNHPCDGETACGILGVYFSERDVAVVHAQQNQNDDRTVSKQKSQHPAAC